MSVDDSGTTADGLSRRGFLGATGAVAVATTVVGSEPSEAAPRVSTAQEHSMILRIAEAGAVFPLRLPTYDEPGPAAARRAIAGLRAAHRRFRGRGVALGERRPATMSRLRAAGRRLPAFRADRARAGADLLIARGLLDAGQAALIEGVGDIAANGARQERDDLIAAVALAVATVFPGSQSAFETTASEWVGLLAIMQRRGTLADALRQRGIG